MQKLHGKPENLADFPIFRIFQRKIFTGWWYTYPSEKWWSSSVGMMKFPTEWKVIKFMFETTNQNIMRISYSHGILYSNQNMFETTNQLILDLYTNPGRSSSQSMNLSSDPFFAMHGWLGAAALPMAPSRKSLRNVYWSKNHPVVDNMSIKWTKIWNTDHFKIIFHGKLRVSMGVPWVFLRCHTAVLPSCWWAASPPTFLSVFFRAEIHQLHWGFIAGKIILGIYWDIC